jgi:hypothetical protein
LTFVNVIPQVSLEFLSEVVSDDGKIVVDKDPVHSCHEHYTKEGTNNPSKRRN